MARGFPRCAGVGFLQRDFHVVAQIRAAAVVLPATAPPAHEVPEQIVEDIGHRGAEVAVEAAAATPVLERGMAEPVVGGPLLRVLERLVGGIDLLEARLGLRVVGIAVRVQLHGELAVGGLQGSRVRIARDTENFVQISFSHLFSRVSLSAPAQGGSS